MGKRGSAKVPPDEPELHEGDGKVAMERLRQLTRKVVSVSREEMERREKEWRKGRQS